MNRMGDGEDKMIARRNGHTLLEVLIVVGILVVVAGISLPMIKPMMANRQKDAAADVVRARWSELKRKAVNNNRAYTFEIKEETGNFRCVAEMEDSFDEGEDAALAQEQPELPGKIKFGRPDSSAPSNGGWTKIVTFLPDGTAKTFSDDGYAKLTFSNGSNSLTLKVHGATGMVSESEGNGR